MGGNWFANRGQVIQTAAAILSGCAALVSLYFVLKSNNSLPKASALLYVSAAVFVLAVGFLIGRRAGRAQSAISPVLPEPRRGSAVAATGGVATATGGSVTQHLHFPVILPASVVSQPLPNKAMPVDMEFVPWHGLGDKMYLTVTNRGPKQSFQAQCRILARRNDPNPSPLRTYDLGWEYGGMAYCLMPGQSGNLLIASAGEDRPAGMEWMRLEAAVGQQSVDSRWNRGEKALPEYDLEIKIIGHESDKPQSARFTVRAGSTRALEMFGMHLEITDPRNDSEVGHRHVVRGLVGGTDAKVQVWVHASNLWHHQGNATATDSVWSLNCWFGREDTPGGVFQIMAVADGNIENKNFEIMPEGGVRSGIVTVRRTR